MSVKLTKRLVDAAEAADGRDTYLWDSEVRGLGLRVQRTGGAKAFVLKYGMGRRGLTRKYTIGRVGSPWTVELARDEARRLLGLIASGVDPATTRATANATPTLAEFAERYLRDHAVPHKKPRSSEGDRANLERRILPVIGSLRLDRVTRADMTRFHLGMKETPTGANRCLALLSHMFTMAEKWGLRPDYSNPCRHVERFRENRRERFLSEAEMARLGTTLGEIEADGSESPYVVAAVRLLIFTGCRMSEIVTLRWDYVDMELGALRLPDSKTGAKVIVLNAPARAVLAGLPRLGGNEYAILGIKSGAPLSDLEHPWRRIRVRAGIPDVRLHDLRHSFASVGASHGESLLVIGALLGHARAETTRRYAHLSDDPLRAAAEAIGDRIAAAMSGGRSTAAAGGTAAPLSRSARR